LRRIIVRGLQSSASTSLSSISNSTFMYNLTGSDASTLRSTYTVLGSYSEEDHITSTCYFEHSSATSNVPTREIILAGRFSSLPGVFWASAIVRYNLDTGQFSPLGDGLSAFIVPRMPFPDIDVLYCDNKYGSVWVSSSSIPGHIGRFRNETWQYGSDESFPLGGLNGKVNSITPYQNGLLFAGNFNSTRDQLVYGSLASFHQAVKYTPMLVVCNFH
jgi:hypothetical protein